MEDSPIRNLILSTLLLALCVSLTGCQASKPTTAPRKLKADKIAKLEAEVKRLRKHVSTQNLQLLTLERRSQGDRMDRQLAIIAEALMRAKRNSTVGFTTSVNGPTYQRLALGANNLRVRFHALRSTNNKEAMNQLLEEIGAYGVRLSEEKATPLPKLSAELLTVNKQLRDMLK